MNTAMTNADLQMAVVKPAAHWHEASGAVVTNRVVFLVSKPPDHWHKASGAVSVRVSSLVSVNVNSGFGYSAFNFRGRTSFCVLIGLRSEPAPIMPQRWIHCCLHTCILPDLIFPDRE